MTYVEILHIGAFDNEAVPTTVFTVIQKANTLTRNMILRILKSCSM